MRLYLIVVSVFIPFFFISAQNIPDDIFTFSSIDEEVSFLIENARDLVEENPAESLQMATKAYNLSTANNLIIQTAKSLSTKGTPYILLQE